MGGHWGLAFAVVHAGSARVAEGAESLKTIRLRGPSFRGWRVSCFLVGGSELYSVLCFGSLVYCPQSLELPVGETRLQEASLGFIGGDPWGSVGHAGRCKV